MLTTQLTFFSFTSSAFSVLLLLNLWTQQLTQLSVASMNFSILWKWLPTPSPSPPNDDQSGYAIKISHSLESEPIQSKLLVTLFANSTSQDSINSITTAEKAPALDSLSFTCEPAFTKLLTSLVGPQPLVLYSTQSLAPRVLQLTYLISSTTINPAKLLREAAISSFERTHSLEMVFDLLPNPTSSHRSIKLAIFDMDSTLIEEEVIDELAGSIGVTDAVSAITARAMNGELDFEESLRERLSLLKGVNTDIWENLRERITIAAGAKELCQELRRRGVILAVASGGFLPMANWLKDQLGLDYAFANHVRCSKSVYELPIPDNDGNFSRSPCSILLSSSPLI